MAPPTTPDRHKILQALYAVGPHTTSAVARMLPVRSRQATHRLMGRMAAAGLVQDIRAEGQRQPVWKLTGAGLAVLKNTDGPG